LCRYILSASASSLLGSVLQGKRNIVCMAQAGSVVLTTCVVVW
jgi:hypothetical protein